MTVAETLTKKLSQLPLSQQLAVLTFVESLEREHPPGVPRRDPEGLLAGQPELSLEDFAKSRREAWRNFPRDIPDE